MSEHHRYIKEIFKHFCKAGLYVKAEKCKFHSELVEYLGYILSPYGLTMSDDKVKIIQDWLEPKKIKDIQSFLSFTNLLSGSALAPNQTLSLDSGMSILKGRILAMPQSTFTTSSPSLFKNNLQPLYELWSSFLLFFV